MPYTSLTSPTQAGELKVAASTTKDFPGLKNTTSGTVRVRLTAKGQWCLYKVPTKDPELAIFNSQTDWKGLQPHTVPNYGKFNWVAPYLEAGSLIAEIKDPQGSSLFLISAPKYIDLAPGCTAEFFMNEDRRWVADNSGEITLSYNCTTTASLPAPVVKTFEGNSPLYQGMEFKSDKVNLKKMISYAGVVFYPYYMGEVQLMFVGFKEGDQIGSVLTPHKSFVTTERGQELKDISIDPKLQMVKLITGKAGITPLIPWGFLADNIASNNVRYIIGTGSDNQYAWTIAGSSYANG